MLSNSGNRISKNCVLLIFLLYSGIHTSCQQVLDNEITVEKIRTGVIHIYNGEFDQANAVSRFLDTQYPNHSISYLFRGMIIYWQNFPILPRTRAGQLFEDCLHKGMDLAEAGLKLNGSDAENLLSGLGSAGLLLLYYADNGESGKVISLAPKTYQWVMKSFGYTKIYKDFYFITGLYNYYREAYAAAHPIYKPVMVFFPHGNKELGLKQLRIASDSSIFLTAESLNFLSGIYQSFERDPAQAIVYSKKLKDKFEQNTLFKTNYVRDLLVIKKYGEAESILKSMAAGNLNNYFQSQLDIMNGIIQEKKYKNTKLAEDLYWNGIRKAKLYGQFGNEFAAYGYFGLSRIYNESGRNKNARQYRKQARELSVFDHINFDN